MAKQIPDSILGSAELGALVAAFPANYNFEIHKSVWRVEELKKELGRGVTLLLQLPQGLQMFGCMLADVFERFCGCDVFLAADENYGACCVEDVGGALVGADFLIHYGHSCLVPLQQTRLRALYVFVDVLFDVEHLVGTLALNFPDPRKHLYLMSVIQFNACLFAARDALAQRGYAALTVPQERPRAGGETLGCTAPLLPFSEERDTVVFVADGRFHLEGAMIQNPRHAYYLYNPYAQSFTLERYDHAGMLAARRAQIFRTPIARLRHVGVILGVLGRQGNPAVLRRVVAAIAGRFAHTVILVSEIFPQQLRLFGDAFDLFVQIACPRLSIDWGEAFDRPLLNTFEFFCLLRGELPAEYANDYYAARGGEWANYFGQALGAKRPKARLELEQP